MKKLLLILPLILLTGCMATAEDPINVPTTEPEINMTESIEMDISNEKEPVLKIAEEKRCKTLGINYVVGSGIVFSTEDIDFPPISFDDFLGNLLQMKQQAEQKDMIDKLGLKVQPAPTE